MMSRPLARLALSTSGSFGLSYRLYSTATSSISDVLKRDHRKLEEYYGNILKAQTSDEKTQWQNQFTWKLARHAMGEDLVVYPLVEKSVADGKTRAEQERYITNLVRLYVPFLCARCSVC